MMPEVGEPLRLEVTEFVALVNQTLEYAYGAVIIRGELANFRVSKNKWLYFDLKDDTASVRFFGTVYALPGPLEDGMMLEVRGTPRLHPQFGFSVTVQHIQPVGDGSIKKAAQLLEAKLLAEGLFDPTRKRTLPYPPERIGLITSSESAAYADFQKVLAARWRGLHIALADVQVQGEPAPGQIVNAIQWFNQQAEPPEIIVIIRGGGSTDDLHAFSTEQVVRAVAASRVPTLVAIGHEVDTSLAELAADVRASTPSNAAELLVPDRETKIVELNTISERLYQNSVQLRLAARNAHQVARQSLATSWERALEKHTQRLMQRRSLLKALNPAAALERGFAIVRDEHGKLVRTTADVRADTMVNIRLARGHLDARVTKARQ